jgi:hypothetical protein
VTRKVMVQKCATCPFRDGSEYAYLRDYLTQSALTEATRFCHSTGNNPAIKRVKVPVQICRGARDLQLSLFTALGILDEPTDQAWERAWKKTRSAR